MCRPSYPPRLDYSNYTNHEKIADKLKKGKKISILIQHQTIMFGRAAYKRDSSPITETKDVLQYTQKPATSHLSNLNPVLFLWSASAA
jgi:hypothetical protein